jgi:hypothetical protein
MGRDLFAATVLAPRAEDGLIDDLDGVAEETTGEPPLL